MIVDYGNSNLLTVMLTEMEKVHFLPGVNEVDDETWAKVEGHPTARHYIEAGHLVVVQGPNKDRKKGTEGLKAYSIGEATRILKKTFDTELLKKWRDTDDRAKILKVIDSQIAFVDSQVREPSTSEATETQVFE